MAGKPRISIEDRFLEKVAKSENGCWIWTAFCMKNGYGLFRLPEGHKLAHRISYELFKGSLDSTLDVMHSCDTPCRVNPDHLELGTRKVNMQDAKIKGRMAKGSRHGRAKLTEAQVVEILVSTEPQKIIASKYGVSPATISDIKNRRKWAHIQSPATLN